MDCSVDGIFCGFGDKKTGEGLECLVFSYENGPCLAFQNTLLQLEPVHSHYGWSLCSKDPMVVVLRQMGNDTCARDKLNRSKLGLESS